jgi:hypothetical protein
MILLDLMERRSETAMSVLAQYLNRPNMFVSFVDIEKLGINPSTQHTSTPIGIYAYPLREAYEMMRESTIPFASDRKYVCLFEGRGEICDIGEYDDSQFEHDYDGICTQLWRLVDANNEQFALSMIEGWTGDLYHNYNTTGEVFWNLTHRIAKRAERLLGREEHIIWNSMLRRLGYAGFVDRGNAVIHPNEPCQALLLSKANCRVVVMLINDHLKGDPHYRSGEAFPRV